jgi:hypothetical protein
MSTLAHSYVPIIWSGYDSTKPYQQILDPLKLLTCAKTQVKSLIAIATAARLFETMPGATMSVQILSQYTLANAKWNGIDLENPPRKDIDSLIGNMLEVRPLTRLRFLPVFACSYLGPLTLTRQTWNM